MTRCTLLSVVAAHFRGSDILDNLPNGFALDSRSIEIGLGIGSLSFRLLFAA